MKMDIDNTGGNPTLHVGLERAESVRVRAGTIVAHSAGLTLSAGSTAATAAQKLARALATRSVTTYTVSADWCENGWVRLAPGLPGEIASHELHAGEEIYIRRGTLVACTGEVELDAKVQKLESMIPGKGTTLTRVRCAGARSGTVFYGVYGNLIALAATPEETIIVDTSHLLGFSFTAGMSSTVKRGRIRGAQAAKLTGSGTVWVQTRSVRGLGDELLAMYGRRR